MKTEQSHPTEDTGTTSLVELTSCKHLTKTLASKRPASEYLSTVVYCATSEVSTQQLWASTVLLPTEDDSRTHLAGGQRKKELPVKPPWSPKSWINCVNTVGSSNDDNLSSVVESVHQGKKGGDDRGVNLVLLTGPHRGQAINLVKKDDWRSHLKSLQETCKHHGGGWGEGRRFELGTMHYVDHHLLKFMLNSAMGCTSKLSTSDSTVFCTSHKMTRHLRHRDDCTSIRHYKKRCSPIPASETGFVLYCTGSLPRRRTEMLTNSPISGFVLPVKCSGLLHISNTCSS